MISFERFDPSKHYDLVSKWWISAKWPVVPLTHLSQMGIIACFDNEPKAAAWIYQTDSAFCLLEWIVASPEIRREKRTEVLSALIEKAKEVSNAMGFKTIFMNARHETLISRLKKHDFQIADVQTTNLTFNIGGETCQKA